MVRKFPFITSSSYLPPLSSDLHFQFPDATFCLIQNPYPIIHPLSSLLPSLCYHLLSCWFILKYNCRWAWLAPKINLTRRWQICILPLDLFFCTGIVFLIHSETGLNDPSDWTESIIYQQGHLTQKFMCIHLNWYLKSAFNQDPISLTDLEVEVVSKAVSLAVQNPPSNNQHCENCASSERCKKPNTSGIKFHVKRKQV